MGRWTASVTVFLVLLAVTMAGCPGTSPDGMTGDMTGDSADGDMTDGTGMDPDAPVGETVTVSFEGPEGTTNGTTDFSFMGASFTGGTVRTLGDPVLYGSGFFAYEVREGSIVMITFEQAVDRVELFFVTRGGGSTVLNLLDESGAIVGSATANIAGAGNSVQVVSQSMPAVAARVVHSGDGEGWIDDFSFRVATP